MQTVLVQITKSYLCLTACDTVKSQQNAKEIKRSADNKKIYTYTSPFIVPVNPEDIEEDTTIWDNPRLIADLVKNGLRQMNNTEVKDVIIMADSFDLTCQEYTHINAKPKVLNNLAIERIKDFVGESVDNFSVISKDYPQGKAHEREISAKVFALPKNLIEDLKKAFTDNMLKLVKIVPTETAMLYSADTSINSFDRTVIFVSMDYVAVRILICKNGKTLYCHNFRSPIEEIIEVIAKDREIGIFDAIQYFRTVGYGLHNDCRTPSAKRKLEDILENINDDIIRNINLVLMSLNVDVEQIYMSDLLASLPHIKNYFMGMGICKNIGVISDLFMPDSAIPEPNLEARDNFYKSGSYFLMNELMNSGDEFHDNLIYGLKATAAKNVQSGKKLASIASIVLVGAMVIVGGFNGFLEVRKMIDNNTMADTKYDHAKDLIANQDKITANLENQGKDAELLPRTKTFTDSVINQLNSQIVSRISSFAGYNITHTRSTAGGEEGFNIPISGTVESFDTFIQLQDNIKNDGYFTMLPSFNIANSDSSNYKFTTTLTVGTVSNTTGSSTN